MEHKDLIEHIISLRNEFAARNFTEDNQNNTISFFFEKIQNSGTSLEGDEKILYDILKDTFVLDFYNASFSGEELTQMSTPDLYEIETWTTRDVKNYISESLKKNEANEKILKTFSLTQYRKLFRGHDQDIAYYETFLEWYLMRKISFLSDGGFFTKNERKENETEINAVYDQLINENEGNIKLYFMHQKVLYQCSLHKEYDKAEQLQTLLKANVEGDYKAEIMYGIMTIYRNEDKNKEALAMADLAKKQFPDSPFLEGIQYKADLITNPSLGLHFEDQVQSQKPIHIVAEHQNISDFSLSIYEVHSDYKSLIEHTEDHYSEGDHYSKIKKKLVREEHYQLPGNENYEAMKTSLEIKPLPPGLYAAEFSLKEPTDKHFSKNYFFTVSDYKILYHHKNKNDFPTAFKLVNSENGKPIPNEAINFWRYNRGGANLVALHSKTDAKGIFEIPSDPNDTFYRKYIVQQPRTNDVQIISFYGNLFPKNKNESEAITSKAQIFTDRKIYRPGQTVYFKVINSKLESEKESVVSGIQQKILLFDANDQEITSQEFTTNEFGSYHGCFVLPKGKLNGIFTLTTEGGAESHHYFRVEEYKRPRFEITFEPVKGEYQYGQNLELKGKAMTFSGIALGNVTVNYEISKKNIRYKFFSLYSNERTGGDYYSGEVTTNDQGEFTISVALEENQYLKGIQVDQFKIEASVTDINGETQSGSVQVNVASVPYYIKAEEIKDSFADENLTVKVETKNYNDQPITKPYYVRLSKLKPGEKIFRSKFETKIQDTPLLSKEEFTAKFPYDYFDKSECGKNRETEKIILDALYTPSNDDNLDLGKLEAGRYKLELYGVQDQDRIETAQYFNIWDRNSIKDEKTFLNVIKPGKEFSRGEKAKIYVYSAIPEALVNIFVQDGLGNTVSEVKEFTHGILEYSIDIPEDKNISGLNILFQLVAYNDIQQCKIDLTIKDNESPLIVETTTFRDNILPGSKEKWAVKVSGKENEHIVAEVLASMYDKALDYFTVHTFKWQKVYSRPYSVAAYDWQQSLDRKFISKNIPYVNGFSIDLPYFNWYDGDLPDHVVMMGGSACGSADEDGGTVLNELQERRVMHKRIAFGDPEEKERGLSGGDDHQSDKIPVRQNLKETAFFFPNLQTDSEGNLSFEFTSPEALTTWKLMFLAHTKDARASILEKEVVTQKEFSLTPNYPRFLREGDELNFQSKLSNLTGKKLSGFAELQILDAFTHEDISAQFDLLEGVQNFEINENGNSALTWKVKVPDTVSSVILKVVAKAGQYSDGEQQAIAVLPNRMLVTDALPIFVKEGETKTFELEKLKNITSTTISNVSNTLELTTHPIWEIIFALPALKNDPNDSADVTFNKWFADVLASEIFKANPKIKTIFEDYKNKELLNSNLEKNQELKQVLLDETPWILESKNEEEQMQKLALLFDVNTMKNSIGQDWDDFRKLQNSDGGFSWYQGYPSSYSTSLYILKYLGKINSWLKDHVKDYQSSEQEILVENLVQYVDHEINRYSDIKKENVWNNWVIDYLDTRNYWEKEYPLKGEGAALKSLIIQKVKEVKITDFTFFGLHRLALLMNDYGLKEASDALITYLKETSVDSQTQGIYWKQNLDGWGWFSSKVVNHAGALEAFNALQPHDQKYIEDMKIWLITQKGVNSWGSSRGTAEVIFTILNSGKSWTGSENSSDTVEIIWGGKEVKTENQATGYVKASIKTDTLDKNLAAVTVTKSHQGIVQGGLFWQYYEDLDKIQSYENHLSITKELYKKIRTATGDELQKISSEAPLKVGDKVTVRMILNTDRPMEFIHIKDMRAAGFEPVDVLSGYQWKNNLGYYQSTKDASTNFYIEYLPKGKYVFEYDYMANASGKFFNGITTFQNYYAPQMSAHTKGDKVEIN